MTTAFFRALVILLLWSGYVVPTDLKVNPIISLPIFAMLDFRKRKFSKRIFPPREVGAIWDQNKLFVS